MALQAPLGLRARYISWWRKTKRICFALRQNRHTDMLVTWWHYCISDWVVASLDLKLVPVKRLMNCSSFLSPSFFWQHAARSSSWWYERETNPNQKFLFLLINLQLQNSNGKRATKQNLNTVGKEKQLFKSNPKRELLQKGTLEWEVLQKGQSSLGSLLQIILK